MLKEYIDFYDESIPIGKRKLQYIKYADKKAESASKG